MGIEIEKKFLVRELPKDYEAYPYHVIEQGYLNVRPAIRVRREDDKYYMTYKGELVGGDGDIGKSEYNLALDKESYEHMILKADGNVIRKTRYLIPLNGDAFDEGYLKERPELKRLMEEGGIKIELDVFKKPYEGRMLAEVEFPDEEAARNYTPPGWFAGEVTGDPAYSNARMSLEKL